MKLSILAVLLFLLATLAENHGADKIPVSERVKFLKLQLLEQLKRKQREHRHRHRDRGNHRLNDNEEPRLINENYDYVDISQLPITPINENDDRKRDDRYKLRQLKTTTTTTNKPVVNWPTTTRTVPTRQVTIPQPVAAPLPPFNPISDSALLAAQAQLKKSRERKKNNKPKENLRQPVPSAASNATSTDKQFSETTTSKPVDVFYRRLIDVEMRNTPIQWTHCEDLITPYLTGIKKELSSPKMLSPTHRTVLRLAHLISLNTTTYSKDDIYSLMYQISNIHMRFFQWEIAALKVLFNAIAKGKKHNFHTLKYAMRNLFKTWHMDISNTTNLLAQSRLFRPYCVNAIGLDGSTKSSKVYKYVSSTTSKNCDEDEEDNRRGIRH